MIAYAAFLAAGLAAAGEAPEEGPKASLPAADRENGDAPGASAVEQGEAAAPASLREELERLREADRELASLLEARVSPLRAAVEDYLEARGITGLALTDLELRPLECALRRAELGLALRVRYENWVDLVDLDEAADDTVDFSEIRTRLTLGYTLAGGPGLELELQGIARSGGLVALSPFDGFFHPPAPGAAGIDPVLALEEGGAAQAAERPEGRLTLRRALVRLPAFNLFGRLAHVPVTLAAGRQELAFGEGFLMGADDDGAGIAYDALRLSCESGGGGRFDAFCGRAAGGARSVAGRIAGPLDPSAEPVVEVACVRGGTSGLLPDSRLAAYLVSAYVGELTSADPGYAAIPRVKVNTAGLEGTVDLTPAAKLRIDAAVQWGEYGPQEIADSGAAALEVRYSRPGGRGPRASAFAAWGSGDRPETPDTFEGFVPFAQDVRGRWEDAGALSSRNTALWGLAASWKAAGGGELGARFTRAYAPEEDSPAGTLLSDGTAGTGNAIGSFASVFAEARLFDERKSRLRLSYCLFAPGDYFDATADVAGRLRLEMLVSF
jgi:hypothetical protein